jgi:RHS repeat-associated protein
MTLSAISHPLLGTRMRKSWEPFVSLVKHSYDVLDRLTSGTTTAITDGWTYDADGNQLTQTGTTPNTFSVSSTSNQLSAITGTLTRSYSYDGAGHTTGYGTLAFTYNDRGRMETASSTDYLYNALGQMIEKSNSSGTTVFMQDESGHLLGEYNGSGGLIEETIWLGDTPVATLQPNGSGGVNVFYVHTDHLNTPRKVAQPTTGTLAWRWDADPFGTATPNQNPAGLGTFPYNLRFPGQYYDAETGLNQNWNRDYDPVVGQYVESDPIGLEGGSYSTYTYAEGDPIWNSDPLGLLVANQGITYGRKGNWPAIQQAVAKISSELVRSCGCHADGCIPCEDVPALRHKLQNSTISVEYLGKDGCGFGALPGHGIIVSPRAFTHACSGCLASTIYHELLHNMGLQHDEDTPPPGVGVNTLERRCMGHLCSKP